MIYLLGELRREMNGAVADSMHYYGSRYGLNYGVSLPTIRTIARKEEQNNSLALYLYKQDVRELRLVSLYIAEPELFEDSAQIWMDGITTSEIAEEMAFALLREVKDLHTIFNKWSKSGNELAAYASIMAAARTTLVEDDQTLDGLLEIINLYPTSRLMAQGTVALLSAAMAHHSIQRIKSVICSLPPCQATEYINEEMAWRME